MRFPLRRNANVLDTLLTETVQILVVFSIMGWPFSGMQHCETKDMGVQQQHSRQQQQQLDPQYLHHQQQHYLQQQQQQQKLHKIPLYTSQQPTMASDTPSSRSSYGYTKMALVTTAVAQPPLSSSQGAQRLLMSSSSVLGSESGSGSSSSLGTHDMHHSAPTIITMDYQHKSAPTSSASSVSVAYTQAITTAIARTTKTTNKLSANEVTGQTQAHAATSTSTILSNGNVNGVGVGVDVGVVAIRPPDMSLHSSAQLRSTTALTSLRPLHRVSKDTQHSSVYAQLPPISSDGTANDSLEIDNMDYVMPSEHIAALTQATVADEGGEASTELSATPWPLAYANINRNNKSNNNKANSNSRSDDNNITNNSEHRGSSSQSSSTSNSYNNNNNNNNSKNNNQTQDDLMSLSLLSASDHNMEMSTMTQAQAQEMALDASLTSSHSNDAASTSSLSSFAAAESASLTAAEASASASASSDEAYAGGRTPTVRHSNRKSAYDRTATDGSNPSDNSLSNNNNMQHLGTQRIALLKTTAKTKTTLVATEHSAHQHTGGKSQATTTTAATAGVGSGGDANGTPATASGRQRGSVKKSVESKYILPKPQKTDAPMLNYIFDTFSSANKHHHHDQRYGPHFEDVQRVGQPTNITVQAGSSIHLNCRISLLQDKTVSWVRRNAQGENALDLLTVGLHTYTGDKRYKMEFQYPNNWRLKITNVKKDDEAMYECQISTHPPRVIQINLFVNAPKVMIVDEFGDPLQEKYYEIDSTLQLSCVVRNVAMATSVVYWKHGDDTLNYDVTRGGISVKTELMDDGANSTLSIAKINKSDSGNYTCAISDFQNFSIVVHILNGESFAELHHGAAAPTVPNAFQQQLVIQLLSLLLSLLLLHAPHQPYTYALHVNR